MQLQVITINTDGSGRIGHTDDKRTFSGMSFLAQLNFKLNKTKKSKFFVGYEQGDNAPFSIENDKLVQKYNHSEIIKA